MNKTSYSMSVLPSAKGIGDVLGRMTVEQVVELSAQAAREAAANQRMLEADKRTTQAAEKRKAAEQSECIRMGRPEYQSLEAAREKERRRRAWVKAREDEAARLERVKQEWLADEIVKAWRVEKAQESLPGLVLREQFERTLKGICDEQEYAF